MSFPARAAAELRFTEAEGGVRVSLRAEVSSAITVRAPRRRKRGEIPAVRAEARARGELAVELVLPGEWTLRRALRETARWLDPDGWAAARRLPREGLWEFRGEIPLELGASALIRGLRVAAAGSVGASSRLSGRIEVQTRLTLLRRVALRLSTGPAGEQLLAEVRLLRRGSATLSTRAGLGFQIDGADLMARQLAEQLWAPAPRLIEEVTELSERLRRWMGRLERIGPQVRELTRRALGPGSSLERLVIRLRRLEALLETSGGPSRVLRQVRSLRREAEELLERLTAVGEELAGLIEGKLARTPLRRRLERMERWLNKARQLEDTLAGKAGKALAEGIAAELTLTASRGNERSAAASARLVPGSAAAVSITQALLMGRLADLPALEQESGLRQLTGKLVTRALRRRTKTLRLHLFGQSAAWRERWIETVRVEAGLTGDLRVIVRERLQRRRQNLFSGSVAALIVEIGLSQRSGKANASLTLTWSRAFRRRSSRRAALAQLQRLTEALADGGIEAAAGDTPPPETPWKLGEEGTLTVISRLGRREVTAMLRRGVAPAVFAREFFWPAWAAAVETGYPHLPPPLLGPGRHPLRDPRVRQLLARTPDAQSLKKLLPTAGRLERESIVADALAGKALLGGILALRRLPPGGTENPATLTRAGRRVLRALRHVSGVTQVPLLAITLLVPPHRRRVVVQVQAGRPVTETGEGPATTGINPDHS